VFTGISVNESCVRGQPVELVLQNCTVVDIDYQLVVEQTYDMADGALQHKIHHILRFAGDFGLTPFLPVIDFHWWTR
jgi:hypothetical protein